jgi:Mlc titration factor MtfA (ptsG expression regulator)
MFAYFVAGTAIVLASLIGVRVFRSRKRARLMARPFPSEWKGFLEKRVALYRHLPNSLKEQLHSDIQVFLAEKRFEGCGGFEITDEVRLTIAAQACILLLNHKTKFFSKLSTILVYPAAYVAKKMSPIGSEYVEEETVRLGESWDGGTLVLAWDHVKHGPRDMNDGHNVVLHEFAHQLDQEEGGADGAPILEHRSSYAPWARILRREYENLREEVRHHVKDVMDGYGATNPAEFFAVATETFFEKPRQFKNKHPELYEQLRGYYKMDPAEWYLE